MTTKIYTKKIEQQKCAMDDSCQNQLIIIYYDNNQSVYSIEMVYNLDISGDHWKSIIMSFKIWIRNRF